MQNTPKETINPETQETFLHELKEFLNDPYYKLNSELIQHPGWQEAFRTLVEKLKTRNLCRDNEILTDRV